MAGYKYKRPTAPSNLRYPMRGDGDYVHFAHFKYERNRSGISRGSGTPPMRGSDIILYMPTSTPAVSNDNGWAASGNPGPVGQLQQDLAALIGSHNPGQAMGQLGQGSANMFGNAVGIGHQMAVDKLSKMVGMNANQAVQLGQGRIFNPNIELFYNGPINRGFTMAFDFIPANEVEKEVVQNIIMEFKRWSSPAATKGSMWEVPDVWSVTYVSGGKQDVMNRFKKSALTKVQVQANPTLDMHATYTDGMPVATRINLEFLEVDVITREDHDAAGGQGY